GSAQRHHMDVADSGRRGAARRAGSVDKEVNGVRVVHYGIVARVDPVAKAPRDVTERQGIMQAASVTIRAALKIAQSQGVVGVDGEPAVRAQAHLFGVGGAENQWLAVGCTQEIAGWVRTTVTTEQPGEIVECVTGEFVCGNAAVSDGSAGDR